MKIGTSALLVLAVLALATSATAYYNVSTIAVSPTGDLTPQAATTVSLVLNFTAPTEKGSFNSSNNLNFLTDLRSPTWQMTLTTDGTSRATVERTGKSVYYNGFSISQPPGVKETMTVILKGYAPPTSADGTFNLITIQEADEYNRAVNGTVTSYSANLVSATPTPTLLPTTIVTTVPTTLPPTTIPTTIVTSPTPTPTPTPNPGVLQSVKNLPLMYVGVGILILVIIIVVIFLIARRNRDYDDEYDEEEEDYEDEDNYEDRRRR